MHHASTKAKLVQCSGNIVFEFMLDGIDAKWLACLIHLFNNGHED